MWVHNDGFHKMKLYLIDKQGNTKRIFKINQWVTDWEEIAIDTDTISGKSYLYAGDMGDNYSWRSLIKIYRIPEPSIKDKTDIDKTEEIWLKYTDGSRDAEAMLIDPLSKELYIISKKLLYCYRR